MLCELSVKHTSFKRDIKKEKFIKSVFGFLFTCGLVEVNPKFGAGHESNPCFHSLLLFLISFLVPEVTMLTCNTCKPAPYCSSCCQTGLHRSFVFSQFGFQPCSGLAVLTGAVTSPAVTVDTSWTGMSSMSSRANSSTSDRANSQ